MKNLFLTILFLSLLIVADLAGAEDFCNSRLVKENNQSLYLEKKSFPVKEIIGFNINCSSSQYLWAEEPEMIDSGNTSSNETKNLKLKDSNNALLYAIFPGCVIHGLGHLYAGKPKTGLLLFSTEALGGILIVRGSLIESGISKAKDEGGPIDELVGGFLFFGSWIYDIIASPLAIKKTNEQLTKGRKIDVKLELKEGSYYLKLAAQHF
jgi:TM2 domain-containing membrane protein YozV